MDLLRFLNLIKYANKHYELYSTIYNSKRYKKKDLESVCAKIFELYLKEAQYENITITKTKNTARELKVWINVDILTASLINTCLNINNSYCSQALINEMNNVEIKRIEALLNNKYPGELVASKYSSKISHFNDLFKIFDQMAILIPKKTMIMESQEYDQNYNTLTSCLRSLGFYKTRSFQEYMYFLNSTLEILGNKNINIKRNYQIRIPTNYEANDYTALSMSNNINEYEYLDNLFRNIHFLKDHIEMFYIYILFLNSSFKDSFYLTLHNCQLKNNNLCELMMTLTDTTTNYQDMAKENLPINQFIQLINLILINSCLEKDRNTRTTNYMCNIKGIMNINYLIDKFELSSNKILDQSEIEEIIRNF